MTRDDIIRMYEKANGWSPKGFENTLDELERFAHLVVDETLNTMHKAIAHEREQCAKVADEWTHAYPHPSKVIAETIRARGNNDKPI
jgi:hypothetical protein